MNAPENRQLAVAQTNNTFDLSPRNFEQALTFSDYLADSDLVPKDFKGRPGNCLIAIQWGAELGLKPLQAMQNLAIINGRPSLWGDAVIALARSSPLCEFILESDDGHTASLDDRRTRPRLCRRPAIFGAILHQLAFVISFLLDPCMMQRLANSYRICYFHCFAAHPVCSETTSKGVELWS